MWKVISRSTYPPPPFQIKKANKQKHTVKPFWQMGQTVWEDSQQN